MTSGTNGSGRKPKQVDLEEAIEENGGAKATIGHNKPELTEDEKRALHYRHCTEYETALAAQKKAAADFKSVCKRIKAEGDAVTRVKKTLKARTPEGEAELRAEMEETLELLRWSGTTVGETKDLFPVDRTPSVDRAQAEGKRDGLAGKPRTPPHDPSVPQYAAWIKGWHEGQDALMSAFQKKPAAPVPADLPAADTSNPPFIPPAADEIRTTSGEDVTQH